MSRSAYARIGRLEQELGELLVSHEGRSLDDFAQYADDPLGFIRDVLKETDPGFWSAQEGIAESVRDHPLTVVQGCNGSGKDHTAARVALWWVYCRRGQVLVTGPTERQVKEIVMAEVARAFGHADDLQGELFQMALRLHRDERAGILAFTSSDASRLTGFHAPRTLVILTEAQGIEDFAWEGLLACATGSEDRVLAVGNPLSPSGRFYVASRSDNWHSIGISAFDHPNLTEDRDVIPGAVTRRFVETIEQEYGKESGVYASRVLGIFPEESEQALVRRAWLEAAIQRGKTGELATAAEHEPIVAAVDPARFGPDESVMAIRQGPVLRELIGWRGKGTMESEERVRMEAARLRAELGTSVHVVVDEIGLGAGIYDRLAERTDVTAEAFNSARSASDPERFFNARAEAFWTLRRLLEDGLIALPDDDRLREELAQIRWSVTSSGQVQIERKDKLKSRLGRSPDRGDACAMAFSVSFAEPFEEIIYGELAY